MEHLLSLEWGSGCTEPCYLVLESLVIAEMKEKPRRTLLLDHGAPVIAGMGERLCRTLLPGLGEPGYRWNGGETA